MMMMLSRSNLFRRSDVISDGNDLTRIGRHDSCVHRVGVLDLGDRHGTEEADRRAAVITLLLSELLHDDITALVLGNGVVNIIVALSNEPRVVSALHLLREHDSLVLSVVVAHVVLEAGAAAKSATDDRIARSAVRGSSDVFNQIIIGLEVLDVVAEAGHDRLQRHSLHAVQELIHRRCVVHRTCIDRHSVGARARACQHADMTRHLVRLENDVVVQRVVDPEHHLREGRRARPVKVAAMEDVVTLVAGQHRRAANTAEGQIQESSLLGRGSMQKLVDHQLVGALSHDKLFKSLVQVRSHLLNAPKFLSVIREVLFVRSDEAHGTVHIAAFIVRALRQKVLNRKVSLDVLRIAKQFLVDLYPSLIRREAKIQLELPRDLVRSANAAQTSDSNSCAN